MGSKETFAQNEYRGELDKRKRDAPKYERYLYNIMQGFSIVDSWNMAIWPSDYEERRRKEK